MGVHRVTPRECLKSGGHGALPSAGGAHDLVALRRLLIPEVLDEIVSGAPDQVGFVGEAVVPVRHHQKVEILVVLNEFVDEEEVGVRMHVVVQRPVHEQKPALEALRQVMVGLGVEGVGAVGAISASESPDSTSDICLNADAIVLGSYWMTLAQF